jgi:RNA polymerase sigma-70 factor (ECF subfamily)
VTLGFQTSPARVPAQRPQSVGDYTRLSDVDLLALVAVDRDQVAFEEFFSRYARSVYSLMVRQLGDAGWADDVVQEAFISVWRFARTYRPERGAVAGWLYTIARNAGYDAARRRQARWLVEAPDRTDPSPTPEDQTAAKLEAFHLHVCIERLPQNEREVIELAYLKGMSQSEIAAELQMPLGTVKTRNRAALRHLAEILEREEQS